MIDYKTSEDRLGRYTPVTSKDKWLAVIVLILLVLTTLQ